MTDPNREALRFVALALAEMIDEVVFIGGAVTGVLITDPAATGIRTTKDVDCIIEVASRAEYDTRIRDQLLNKGFSELTGDDIPICAWQKEGVRLDVMPTDEKILGFSRQWYDGALKSAMWTDIGRVEINVISAPYFLATKLAAFHSRGKGNYLTSHDIEDVIAVIDGRVSLASEVASADEDVKVFIKNEMKIFLSDDNFLGALPGLILDVGRESIVRERMMTICQLL